MRGFGHNDQLMSLGMKVMMVIYDDDKEDRRLQIKVDRSRPHRARVGLQSHEAKEH